MLSPKCGDLDALGLKAGLGVTPACTILSEKNITPRIILACQKCQAERRAQLNKQWIYIRSDLGKERITARPLQERRCFAE